jgi:hypothetical protein
MLFKFALDCARRSPDISFALRPHPLVDTKSLLNRLPALQKLPENVSLSIDKPLEQELAQVAFMQPQPGQKPPRHGLLAVDDAGRPHLDRAHDSVAGRGVVRGDQEQ